MVWRTPRILDDGIAFGRYRIVRLIATGGMSEVYEAVHVDLDKSVALKVMRPDLAQNEEARARFVAEGKHAARIRHTNVVDVTDVGIQDDLPYLVMALLSGEDLGALFERRKRLPVHELVDLLLPVAGAVMAGHEQGVVHRDLKPENVFLHREGTQIIPKVLDFGVSRVMSARRITVNACVFGTPHYMSPEQARGASDADERSDQYAFGVMLYEGLTGRLPRDSQNPLELLHAVAFEGFPPPSRYIDLPEVLEGVILRAMQQNPQARFASMRDLAAELIPFARSDVRERWRSVLGVKSIALRPDERTSGVVPRQAQANLGGGQDAAGQSPLLLSALRKTVPASSDGFLISPSDQDGASQLTAADGPLSSARPKAPARFRPLLSAAIAAAAIGAGAGWFLLQPPPPRARPLPSGPAIDAPEYYEVDVQVTPPSATLIVDGEAVGVSHYTARMRRDGSKHVLSARADGFLPYAVSFRDSAPPSRIALVAAAPQPLSADGVQPSEGRGAAHGGKSWRSAPRKVAPQDVPNARVSGFGAEQPLQPSAASKPIAIIDAPRPRVRIVDDQPVHVKLVE